MLHFKILILCSLIFSSVVRAADQNFSNFSTKNPTDKIDNPFAGMGNLYDQIFVALNSEYEHIGRLSAQKVLNNNMLITGGLNSIGFNYRRPFLDFGISLNRTLAPDLYSNSRWIVTDTFTIHIDASKVLTRLKNEKAIDINDKNLAMFAGIVFERKFTWFHFANSYEEGLSTHFEKLFFPFKGVSLNSIQNLSNEEFITKEDSISINSGAFVSAPVYNGINLIGGALAKFQKLSKMELTRKSSDFGGAEQLMLSFEKSKTIVAGVSLSLQADFLKLLRMTLLSYDFSYKLDSSYKIYTQFSMSEIKEMTEANPVQNEIQAILKTNEPNLLILAPYIISEEKKLAETITHKYNFLLIGGAKEAKSQQIEVMSKGILKTFFRHYYEKVKYTEDFMSRLFSSFIFAIFNSDIKAANNLTDSKKVTIEYDSVKNLLESKDDLNISNEDSQKLSLMFTGEFNTKRSNNLFGKKYKDRVKYLLESYSGVNPLAVNMVEDEELVAPFTINGTYQVNTDGIRFFNSLNTNEVFDNFESICGDKPKNIFLNFLNLFDNCRRSLQNNYMDYLKDLSHEKITSDLIVTCEKKAKRYWYSPSKKRAFIKTCLADISAKNESAWVEIPLWQLKNLSQDLVNNTNNKIYYYNLFGLNNTFFHGTFLAVTKDGADFVSHFHEGQFKGLGTIDNFMRQENLRNPASIVVDEL